MLGLSTDNIISIFSMVMTAGAIYGAIKSDIKHLLDSHKKLDEKVEVIENRLFLHIESHK